MIPLLIFPCNGNGVEALDCLGDRYKVIGFVDDHPDKLGTEQFGYPVLSRSALDEHPLAQVLAVPGGPSSYLRRGEIIDGLGLQRERFARVIHPSASVSPRSSIGINVLIMAGAVVTSNAIIGDHVCVLPNSVVHHDSCVGELSLVGAGVTIAGGVSVGKNCYVGSGSAIINGVSIGDRSLVGLGSNVIRDVSPDCVVAGNPARRFREERA